MTRVVATGAIRPVGHLAFSDIGPIDALDERAPIPGDTEVLLVRSRSIRGEEIDRVEKLKIIARTGSGVDNVDVAAATRRGVPVVFAPAVGARPVAEGAMALILAAAKRIGELHSVLEEGRWGERYEVEGLDLHEAVLGLVGFGDIGREVARFATAFGMQILAHDPHLGKGDAAGARFMSLTELVAQADVVSLHCPLTRETRGVVDRGLIEAMKPGAILVNTARGEIIAGDQILLEALDDGQLSAVALDVFEHEPPPTSSKLLADPRVICSPHTIGLTRNWNKRVFSSLAEDVARHLRGERPNYVVDDSVIKPRMEHRDIGDLA